MIDRRHYPGRSVASLLAEIALRLIALPFVVLFYLTMELIASGPRKPRRSGRSI